MQIGDVIRKYRKERGLTQEEMAHQLGVTAPAVNKWEHGNSLPDIMLLAPIARLLHISLDELLSFQAELSQDQIKGMIQEIDGILRKEGYNAAVVWAKEKVRMYPNSEELALRMAVIFDAWRLLQEIPASKQYDEMILTWYQRGIESSEEQVRSSAADSLYAFYLRKEDYQKAEEYLEYFSDQNPEKKRKRADLYRKMGKQEEAYRMYEELLFFGYQMISVTMHGIYQMAMEQQNFDKAHVMVDKQEALAVLFEMGNYHQVAARLDLAVAEQDEEAVLDTMEQLLESVDQISAFTDSALYEHMDFRKGEENFRPMIKENLRKCFRDETTYGFLKDRKRWQALVKSPAL